MLYNALCLIPLPVGGISVSDDATVAPDFSAGFNGRTDLPVGKRSYND